MKQNKYDDALFFDKYSQMQRSLKGLEAAGEWHVLQSMLPIFKDKRVLDLGCGFGWHCRYAVAQGASSVVGIDISQKMIQAAKQKTHSNLIQYQCLPIEDIDFPANTFDVVISSLVFHYVPSFENICRKIANCLGAGGSLVFSVEHPIFTAYGTQDWYYDTEGNILHWPVDHYFTQGQRQALFLGEDIIKYHKTLTTYLNGLINAGFEITALVEPEPAQELLHTVPGMLDELRRPMMLLVSAIKK